MTHDCDFTIFLFHWFLMRVVLFLFTIFSKLKKIYTLVNFMLTAQMDNPGSADIWIGNCVLSASNRLRKSCDALHNPNGRIKKPVVRHSENI